MTNKEQEFISDLIKAEQIFLNGLISKEIKLISKASKLIEQMILNSSKYYNYVSAEFRLKNIVQFISNIIKENNLKYLSIDQLELGKAKQLFQYELVNQVNKKLLSDLKFMINSNENKEQIDNLINELFNRVIKVKDLDNNLNNEQLKNNLLSEITSLSNKFTTKLTTKIACSNINLDLKLENLVGKNIVTSAKKQRNVFKENNFDLTEENVSEQARILGDDSRCAAERTFAAKVLCAQNWALRGKEKQKDILFVK